MNKHPVLITVDSICDLPLEFIRKYNLIVNPYFVETPDGRFMDNIEIGHENLVQYVNRGGMAKSASPQVDEYEWFFDRCKDMADQIIHITIANKVGIGYEKACQAAKKFSNITVFNSRQLSSTVGLLAIRAGQLAMLDLSKDDILENLTNYRKYLSTEFLVKDLEYMYRAKRLPRMVRQMSYRFVFRLSLKIKKDKITVGRVMIGSWENSIRHYIRKLLRYHGQIDESRVFITHVGLDEDTLRFIISEINRYVTFEEIICVNASAAISCNCGPGSFGVLFAKYDGTEMPDSIIDQDGEGFGEVISPYKPRQHFVGEQNLGQVFFSDKVETPISSDNFFDFVDQKKNRVEDKNDLSQKLKFLDYETGLTYAAGSEELFVEILKEYISEDKSAELGEYLKAEDWENYRIAVHALKSTSKTIGVMDLSEEARLLEYACKDEKYDYVVENHKSVMEHYKKLCRSIWEAIG